jgi:hypothetical protein
VSEARGRVARIHVGLALCESICVTAFVIEVLRALGGNTLSWAYVFEWPLFGAYGVYMWHQLVRQERGDAPARPARPDKNVGVVDERMASWNEYLRQVHERESPPGS